ncbi:MAG TPA: hypothetical protein VFZ66_06215 [Herpetosiphonaceae bacterium]
MKLNPPTCSVAVPPIPATSVPRAACLGHFAANDEFEPLSQVAELKESLKRAGRPVTCYRYGDTRH